MLNKWKSVGREFRHALTETVAQVLEDPVVVAVVATKDQWRAQAKKGEEKEEVSQSAGKEN